MNRKGQAALEFLMTYGWAILVVLVVIGALAYFGVLNPDSLVPDKCTLTTGISCDDHQIIGGSSGGSVIHLSLGNGQGRQILITNVTAILVENPSIRCINESNMTLKNGASTTVTLTNRSDNLRCMISQSGRKPRFNINVTYQFTDGASFSHISSGELLGTVQ